MHLTTYIENEGTLELNWMWLPTFIGMSTILKRQIDEYISPLVIGKEVTEELLSQLDQEIIKYVVKMHPIPGLTGYLEALLGVRDG
jgi:hypothetical protein